MNRIVFMDIDGTLVDGQTQQFLAKYLFKKNKINFFSALRIYFWFLLYKLNIVRDVDNVMKKFYQLLRGVEVESFKKLLVIFFNTEVKPVIFAQLIDIIQKYKNNKKSVILISNTIQPLVDIISHYVGADKGLGTRLKVVNGYYTGDILGKVLYGKNKVDIVKKNNWNLKGSVFYTDHYSDIPLLNLVENRIIVNPDKKLKKIAEKYHWEIKHFNL